MTQPPFDEPESEFDTIINDYDILALLPDNNYTTTQEEGNDRNKKNATLLKQLVQDFFPSLSASNEIQYYDQLWRSSLSLDTSSLPSSSVSLPSSSLPPRPLVSSSSHQDTKVLLRRNLELKTELQTLRRESERSYVRHCRIAEELLELKAKESAERTRIEHLESALQESSSQVSILSSQVNVLHKSVAESHLKLAVFTGKEQHHYLSRTTTRVLEEYEEEVHDGLRAIQLEIKKRRVKNKTSSSSMCIVCTEKPVTVVLLPCRHQVLCTECAERITNGSSTAIARCPVDRQVIKTHFTTFGV